MVNKVRLQDIIDVRDGTHDSPKYVDNGFPLITSKNIKDGKIDFTSANLISENDLIKINKRSEVKNGDIIMPMIGTIGNPVVVNTNNKFAIKNVALFKSDQNGILDNNYLFYYLKSNYFYQQINSIKRGGTQSFISLSDIRNLNVPIFDINYQRNAVSVLRKVESLMEKRKLQITALSDLKHSIFLKMFGDPHSNKYQIKKVKISDVIESLKAGLSTGGETKIKSEGEYGVLTTSAVTYGTFNPNAYKVPIVDIKDSNKIIHPTKNSILVSRMNTKELVGASCIVEDDFYDLFIPDRLWKLTLKEEVINPYYFIFAIQQDYFRMKISKEATGTSGSMLNISQIKFKNMEIILPHISEQNNFASISEKISKKRRVLEQSLDQLKNQFDSLTQQVFNGELFNK